MYSRGLSQELFPIYKSVKQTDGLKMQVTFKHTCFNKNLPTTLTVSAAAKVQAIQNLKRNPTRSPGVA